MKKITFFLFEIPYWNFIASGTLKIICLEALRRDGILNPTVALVIKREFNFCRKKKHKN